MADILALTGEGGNYISIVKVLAFVVSFGLWAWVGQWLDKDAPYVRTNRSLWNNIYFFSGTGAALLWFLLPAPFLVNWLFFLVVWLTVIVAYRFHRNARVSPEEQILTIDHIKSLMSRQGRVKQTKQRLVFITANKNELPAPIRQDASFDSYVLAEELLYDMWYRRVSHTELLPISEDVQLRYVIDGVMGLGGERQKIEAEQIISYLKEIADLDVKDRRKPQNGRFSTKIEGRQYDWKIKTAGSTRGEQMVLDRIEESKMLALDALGFNKDQLEKMQQLITTRQGLVLVSGPPKSGVTTTLYSILKSHDAFVQNINTLEIEFMLDLANITQSQIKTTDPEKNSLKQLQTVLRSDPDVALVGFFDDPGMAKFITKFVSEDKKVYVGINAPTTFDCLQSWFKAVGNAAKVSETLQAVTNQRLVRKLCPACKKAYSPDNNLLRKLNLPADKIKNFYRPPNESELEYDKKGNPIPCPTCQNTGYFGRIAIYETLFITDPIRDLIRDNAPVNTIRAQSRKDKMRYLQEQAIRKVIDGTTSIQEVLRVTAVGKPQPSAAAKATPPRGEEKS